MALKLIHPDGTTGTITDEEIAQIEEHQRGKTLAEIAAEPPAFRHLAERRDPPQPRKTLTEMVQDVLAAPPMPRSQLDQWARVYGLSAIEGESDADLRQRITDLHRP